MRGLTLVLPLVALSACGAAEPREPSLPSPCSADRRVAPDSVYKDLALSRVVTALYGTDRHPLRSEQDRESRLSRVESYRRTQAATVADGCLRVHALEWVDFYERRVREMVVGEPSDYERSLAESEDRRRALADKLGVGP